MKSVRQRRIAQLIRGDVITSQRQLVELLRGAGVASTQPTVSRDLEELGAFKIRKNGKIAYALPGAIPRATGPGGLTKVLEGSLLGLESSGNLLVLTTPPGHAHMVASTLDASELEGVAGTVAGDDTVLLVSKQGIPARRVERRLRSLMQMLDDGPVDQNE